MYDIYCYDLRFHDNEMVRYATLAEDVLVSLEDNSFWLAANESICFYPSGVIRDGVVGTLVTTAIGYQIGPFIVGVRNMDGIFFANIEVPEYLRSSYPSDVPDYVYTKNRINSFQPYWALQLVF